MQDAKPSSSHFVRSRANRAARAALNVYTTLLIAGCSAHESSPDGASSQPTSVAVAPSTTPLGETPAPASATSVVPSPGVQPATTVTAPGTDSSTPASTTGAPAPAAPAPVDSTPVNPTAVAPVQNPEPAPVAPAPVAPDAVAPVAPVAPDAVAPDAPQPGPDIPSAELVASLELGWNLGNSLDVPEGETAWNNPVVSRELLEAVAAAGFDLVRVPVTWSLFMGPGPDYLIDVARLERVEEVLGYVLDSGMHAIVNIHHDGADAYDGVEWLSLNDASGEVSEVHNAAVEAQFVAVWTQLAERFKPYPSTLLLESMNEIHDGYDAPDPAYYDIINRLNQVFVDTVRATGGNNASRHLVVPGYNTNIDYTLEGFELPDDPATDKLILSVHFYDPWTFAGEASTPAWGVGNPGVDSWGQEDFVVTQFDRLRSQYVEPGIPVVIGEYGATNLTGSENYRRYYMEYVTQAACQRGILPIYWDNGGTGSGPDNFALFERATGEVVFPDILDAIVRASKSTAPLDAIAAP